MLIQLREVELSLVIAIGCSAIIHTYKQTSSKRSKSPDILIQLHTSAKHIFSLSFVSGQVLS